MSFRRFPLGPALGRAALALLAACLARPACATTYTITVTADGVSTNGNCTLREAIRAAINDAAVDLCPAGSASDTIVLAAPAPYAFIAGEEVIWDEELTIEGATSAAGAHVIELGGNSRFLRIEGGSKVTLSRLTVRNGSTLLAAQLEGGCLRVTGSDLTLRDAVISGCLATRGGGLWFLSSGANQAVLERVTFLDNEARGTAASPSPDGGGAFVQLFGAGTATISGSLFQENRVASALSGSSTAGSGLVISTHDPEAEVTVRRSTWLGNEEESATGGQGTLTATIGSGLALLEDLWITGNASVSGSEPHSPVGLGLIVAGAASVELARLRLTGNTAVDGEGVQAEISVQAGGSLALRSVLVADGPRRGLDLYVTDVASALLGHLTVTGHLERGLFLSGFSTGALRLENSLLWNNGLVVASDLVTTGTVDADRLANHNWVGSLGDPHPQLVDPGSGNFDPQPGSPLVDLGDRTFAAVDTRDALGRPRVVGGETDIGALEEPGLLFADGFESGDTSAWSQVVP